MPQKKKATTKKQPKKTAPKKQNYSLVIWLLVLIIVVAAAGTGCALSDKISSWFKGDTTNENVNVNTNANANQNTNKSLVDELKPKAAVAGKFATYDQAAVSVNPALTDYTVESDLSNITNTDQFYLSEAMTALIAENGFAVEGPGFWQEFFSLYEQNRYMNVPSFITTDSMLHNYHLAFDYLLRTLEKDELVTEVTSLSKAMLEQSKAQYNTLQGTDWEDAARRNVGYFTVVSKLLDDTVEIPSYVKTEVDQELALIEAHGEIKESPVMNIGHDLENDPVIDTPAGELRLNANKEDYSQYVPRGHYTKSDELKKYFKAMMYLGRLTFRLKTDEETQSALLITMALAGSEDLQKSWDRLYEPTVFFVGKTDDLSYHEYYDTFVTVYGEGNLNLTTVTSDDTKFQEFWDKALDLDAPQINSMPIFAPGIQPDREVEIKGFRFMGQRFTIDASVFQRLIYREVGDKVHTCADDPTTWANCGDSRCLPKALDIPAAMGSAEALGILDGWGETEYACYSENMNKMNTYIVGLDSATWTQNLYWGWMHSLRPLLEVRGEGYPTFMQNNAWNRKNLTTYLGSWTELKRDTILYAKQVYAELGGGAPEEKDDRGYVEPNPEVYARLAALTKMTREGLQIRGLLSDEKATFLETIEELATNLKTISEKELNSQALSDDDYDLIRGYGGSLENIWLQAFEDRGIETTSQLSDEPAPVVADVATAPGGTVLEEGTGNIADIYVVFSLDGTLRIAKGGVYTHYEFDWPASDRLTDEAWRELLASEDRPDMAEWTASYMSQLEY